MQKIFKILPIRINLPFLLLGLAACAAPAGQQAREDIGPVTAYARNSLAAENPVGLVRLGEGFERSGDYAGARLLYSQAIEAASDLVEAHIAFARATAKLGNGDEAIAKLTLLLRTNPDNRAAKSTLAQIHADSGRYDAANSIWMQVQNQSPLEQLFAGKLLHAVGQPAEGHRLILEALDREPGNAEVLQGAALSFALVENYASAVSLLRQALDRPQQGTRMQRSMVLIYAVSGQRQLALQLAREILPVSEMQRLDTYFRYLPDFTKQEQAAALFFDRIPQQTVARLIGNATN